MSLPLNRNLLSILSVTIEDCLGCKMTSVKFSQVDSVHLLLYNLDNSQTVLPSAPLIVTPIGNALQLMCSTEFADAASLQRLPQLEIGKGCVKMVFMEKRMYEVYTPQPEQELDFTPSTSRQAAERREVENIAKELERSVRYMIHMVNVERRFDVLDKLDRIRYQVNGDDWCEVEMKEFHSLFFVQPAHTTELMRNLDQEFANNWLKIIQADANTYSSLKEEGNPFDTFTKLFECQDSEQPHPLQKLATSCLVINEKTRLRERRFLLDLFEKVRFIFEFLTINEYTVWFFVPLLDSFVSLDKLNVNDFDLTHVRTSIKLTRDAYNRFWRQADHNIIDILLVAFQMALAQVAKQSVLFLGQLDKLSEFACLQYVTAVFMNSINTNDVASTRWYCSRYLHRIIEMSESLGLVVFIEYPGGLTLLPENRKIIKCVQQPESSGWQVSEDVTMKSESGLQRLKDVIDIN